MFIILDSPYTLRFTMKQLKANYELIFETFK